MSQYSVWFTRRRVLFGHCGSCVPPPGRRLSRLNDGIARAYVNVRREEERFYIGAYCRNEFEL